MSSIGDRQIACATPRLQTPRPLADRELLQPLGIPESLIRPLPRSEGYAAFCVEINALFTETLATYLSPLRRAHRRSWRHRVFPNAAAEAGIFSCVRSHDGIIHNNPTTKFQHAYAPSVYWRHAQVSYFESNLALTIRRCEE